MRTFKNRWGEQYQAGVGTVVDFKCDVEQCGIITKIVGDTFHLAAVGHDYGGRFSGGYIGGDRYHAEHAEDCSVEG